MVTLKSGTLDDVEARVVRIAEVLDGLKAESILALDLRGVADFTDFFVIATMRSQTQMGAAADQIMASLRTDGVRPFSSPEDESPNWSVLDYGDVVVHLFEPRTRDHYRLEELWGDASEFHWQSRALA